MPSPTDVFAVCCRKFSLEQRDVDDEDGNTVYRRLAVPVDIRQVIEGSHRIARKMTKVFLHQLGRPYLDPDSE